jgi:co-chaperonin GroES (HSP10)
MTKIHPVGERMALVNTEEAYEGKIVLPDSSVRSHVHGKCIAVGNGIYPDGTEKEIYVKVGEVYLYQIDGAQKVNASFNIDGQLVLLLHQGDMICRLNAKTVSFDSIDMMGHWLLVEPYYESTESTIIVPDSVKERQTELHHFRLAKKGPQSTIEAETGDEIFPARGRLTPLNIDGKVYCFIQDNFIYGHLPSVTQLE